MRLDPEQGEWAAGRCRHTCCCRARPPGSCPNCRDSDHVTALIPQPVCQMAADAAVDEGFPSTLDEYRRALEPLGRGGAPGGRSRRPGYGPDGIRSGTRPLRGDDRGAAAGMGLARPGGPRSRTRWTTRGRSNCLAMRLRGARGRGRALRRRRGRDGERRTRQLGTRGGARGRHARTARRLRARRAGVRRAAAFGPREAAARTPAVGRVQEKCVTASNSLLGLAPHRARECVELTPLPERSSTRGPETQAKATYPVIAPRHPATAASALPHRVHSCGVISQAL